jgi:ParB family chromosome partitioning protein
LPESVLKLIETKKLSPGHAKILVGLNNAEFVANKIVKKNFSVRQAENFVKIFKRIKQSPKSTKDANIKDLEFSIAEKIGLNVLIKNKKNNTGLITFEYKDFDQLNKIIDIIKSNY